METIIDPSPAESRRLSFLSNLNGYRGLRWACAKQYLFGAVVLHIFY